MSPTPTKMQEVSIEMEEIKSVMRDNIEKVLERGANLDRLESKSEALQDGASRFQNKTKRLRRHMWCQDKKMTLILVAVITVILTVIILSIAIPLSR
jgi:hypothetical protein